MGGVSSPALAGAVAGTGALGMIGAAMLPPDVLAAQIDEAGRHGRVGVNFLMPFLDVAAFDVAASRAGLVECFYADPDRELVERAHDAGALIAWQVGSVDEAVAAAGAGCDFVVVQGVEAGGHVRGTAPLLPLLAGVRAQVGVPLVAAGGIGSTADAAAALEAGADGVRIGTLLVAAEEADVHPSYTDALVAAEADDTVLTEAFSLGWPSAPHRVLRSCVDACDDDPATRSPLPPTRGFVGPVERAALYAGRSVSSVQAVEPAADVVRRLAAGL